MEAGSRTFQLKACIFHKGSTVKSGHYVALCRRSSWVLLDDAHSEERSEGAVELMLKTGPSSGSRTYILFYERDEE